MNPKAGPISNVVCPGCKRTLDDVIESLIRQRGKFKGQREIARRERDEALAEVERLRQGLWDCAIASGFDHDGDLTPKHCASDIVEVALREVRQLRDDYNEALRGDEYEDASVSDDPEQA